VPGNTEFPITSAGLIISSSPKIFIDTNMGPLQTRELLDQEKPDIVIVSHYHLDHAIIGPWTKAYSPAELMVPEGEEKYLTDLDHFLKNTIGPHDQIDKWVNFINKDINYSKIEDFSIHSHGMELRSGDITVKCIRGAGHSPSHTSFYIPEAKVLFASDIGLGPFGPWYGWLDCDLKEYIKSIQLLRSLDVDTILTCHDGIINTGIDEAWERCLGHFFKRERFISDRLAKGKTKHEIVEQGIYFMNKSRTQEPMRTFLTVWDSIMFDHHAAMLDEGSLCKTFPELV
jgi:hydroxyacylglutathione hydrolase